jgi:hypothetical protein
MVSNVPSRISLGRQLCNPGLELALLGTDRLDLNSIDLSILSVEALDDILAGASFSIDSEDHLLKRLLSLGDEYRPLLRWIEIRFLSATGLAALTEDLAFPPGMFMVGHSRSPDSSSSSTSSSIWLGFCDRSGLSADL